MSPGDARQLETQVAPTRRLAHHLKVRHAQAAIARGLDAWITPDIVTWSGLIERMFQTDRAAGRTGRRWLHDATARLAWERIVAGDPRTAGVISPSGLARLAHRSWRRMHDHRIPLGPAQAFDGPEVGAFMAWAAEFADWLSRHGWVDEATAQAEVDPRSAGACLRFVGFDTLTPGQAAFVERMRQGGIEVVVEPGPVASDAGVWVSLADRDAELDAAARWAARRLDATPGRRLAIVVPGLSSQRARVRRLLDRVLAPEATVCGGPAPASRGYALASARPLAEQPVVTAALEWLAAFTHDTSLATCSSLLRSPFCTAAESESGSRAALDASLRRREGPDLGLPRLAAQAAKRGCPQFASLVNAGLAAAAGWPRRALPSRWSQLHFELLRRIGWPGEGLDSEEHQARERFQALIGESGVHDDVAGPVNASRAIGLLREFAESTLFEPQEPDSPLVVIDPETSAGMRFDALWVCGLDAGQWPAPASPDPFLPRGWQSRQAVPGATAEQSAAEARCTFERLRASASEVVFSVPAFEDEAPLLPSALLAEVRGAPVPELWAAPTVARRLFASKPVLEDADDDRLPALAPGERAFGGARLLELEAACPFRAAAELRLGALPLEEPTAGLDAASRGTLVHDVLARLWQEAGTSAAMRDRPAGERVASLRSSIAAALAPLRREANGVLLRLLEIEARWLEREALQLLEADLARPDFAVVHVEAERRIAIGGLELTVRVDRVDRLADGTLAVIDYKTGASAHPRAWLDERPRLPQLPLYVEAFDAARTSAVAFGRIRAGATGFVGLARDPQAFPGCSPPPRGYAGWDDLLAAWRRRLEALAREFAGGEARLAPDPPRACPRCHLAGLCRIGEARFAAEEDGTPDE